MAGAPLRRGGSEDGWIDAIAKGAVVVIIRLSNGKEVLLFADDGAHIVEEGDYVFIDYTEDSQYPKLEVSRSDDVIFSCAVPAGNISPIFARMC